MRAILRYLRRVTPTSKTGRLVLLIICLSLLFNLCLFGYRRSSSAIQLTARHYADKTYEINNRFAQLPQPKVVSPGQSSGNTAALLTNYKQFTESIHDFEKAGGFTALAAYQKTTRINSTSEDVNQELDSIQAELEKWTATLEAAQKFIEYDPRADAEVLKQSPDRFDAWKKQTLAGLTNSRDELRRIDLPAAKQLSEQAGKATIGLNDVTLVMIQAADYPALRTAQQESLIRLQAEWQSFQSSRSKKLTDLADAYTQIYQ